jgi:hypothetical protein
MKKVTMNAIANVLSSIDFENKDAILAELNSEINRGADAKAQKWAEYDAVKPIVLDALSDTPVTIAELYDTVRDALPEGFSKGKIQYAVTRLWSDEITKIEGNPNTYARA